jgi:tetratricopeptide (TPR) repeat protein
MNRQHKSAPREIKNRTATRTEHIAAYIIRRQKSMAILVSLTLAVMVGVLLWYRYQDQQDRAAQSEMYQATYEFEAGSFEKALTGDESHAGFLDILQDYRFTKAANLAQFYVGIIYMHQASYTEAIQHLQQFKADDFLLQARAWSLIGDAYVQQQAYDQAIKYYLKAADYKPNEFFTPIYLIKAALAYEAKGNYKNACQSYERITKDYPKSSWYEEAAKHASRLAALS